MKMRLRNRNIPQAGTGVKSNGESRPGPPGSGSPSYSGGGTVPHTSVQSNTDADNNNLTTINAHSYPTSPTSSISLFSSPHSSPKSYMFDHSSSSRSTTVSPMSDVVTRVAIANYPMSISDITQSTSTYQNSNLNPVDHNIPSPPQCTNSPVRSVLQDMLPPTTLAGKSRQRMKWTDHINKELLRCYYIVTSCETNLTAFRPQLHKKFIETFPELSHISEQRLADQIRVIHRNNRISTKERNEIKTTVAQTFDSSNTQSSSRDTVLQASQSNLHATNTDNQTCNPTSFHSTISACNQPINISTSLEASEYNTLESNLTNIPQYVSDSCPTRNREIEIKFTEMLIKYSDTDPALRPAIPKLQITRKIIKTVNILNTLIGQYLEQNETCSLDEIHTTIYCAAITTATLHSKITIPPKQGDTHKSTNNKSPNWQIRIENRIKKLRKEIGQLTQYLKGNLTPKNQKKINPKNLTNNQIVDILDNFKQKLQAQSKRLRRLKISNSRRKDNSLFNNNQKIFYQNLNADNIKITQPPDIDEVRNYWESLWSQPTQHNSESPWLDTEIRERQSLSPMSEIIIYKADVTYAIKKTLNWKAPGPDKIQNYWIKYFTATHTHIADTFNSFIQDPQTIPPFLTQGITYLKPKDNNDTTNPTKYRPITCLPTIYKLLTSIITQKLNAHITQNKIIPEEQKGCAKGSMGCKEQLIIDAEIHNQVKQNRKNLYYSYIDYQKAFDSVPHSWLIHVLKIYKVDDKLIQLLESLMSSWSTTLNLRTTNTNYCTSNIKIKRGIFQGDSLSPLWFCLALNPLSKILNKSGYGYIIDKTNNIKLTHLLYMDDIKLYATDRQQLEHLLRLTEKFSTDIKMSFGTDKCKINCIFKGQHTQTESVNLELQEGVINSMQANETYKYLGYIQNTAINHKEIKNILKSKYKQRLKKILSTQLSGHNKIKAINTYAVPILTYSFGIIKWADTELQALNTVTRTLSYKYNIHHIHSAVERFTLKRKLGGRGAIDIKNLHYSQIDNLRKYFINKANTSQLHNAIINIPHSRAPLYLNNNQFNPQNKIVSDNDKITKWKGKALHGKFPHQLQQDHIDKDASFSWLTRGNIYSETEGFLFAIQDQIIKTRNYSKYILKENIETDKCRLCHQITETIDHITGGCNALASKEYTHRHNNVAKHIHQLLAIKYKLIDTHTPYYKYSPNNVLENNAVKLYWDRDIVTDRTILSNRPDITLTIKSEKTTYLIDITIPNTNNLKIKHNEKIQKYIPLADEIKQMWRQNTVKIVPIIISSTGVIPKTLAASLKILELHKNTFIQLQKSVVIDTSSIVRRFLNPSSSLTTSQS